MVMILFLKKKTEQYPKGVTCLIKTMTFIPYSQAHRATEFKKLRKRIVRMTQEAINQYGMIEKDARWLVCLSGGKDSYTLLAVLYELKFRGLLPVDILACNLDQGQPNFLQLSCLISWKRWVYLTALSIRIPTLSL